MLLFIVNFVAFSLAEENIGKAVLFLFMLIFTGPGAGVGATLILLMTNETLGRLNLQIKIKLLIHMLL